MDWKKLSGRKLTWRVDEAATSDELNAEPGVPLRPPAGRGRLVYVDEHGLRRHLPPNLAGLTPDQRDAALAAMSQSLGAGPPDLARMAAIERLTELRAAGKMSEEQYHKGRRRLESY